MISEAVLCVNELIAWLINDSFDFGSLEAFIIVFAEDGR